SCGGARCCGRLLIERAVGAQHDLVFAPRRLARDVAEPHVAHDTIGLARRRIAETAAARRLQSHLPALADRHIGDLRDEVWRRLALTALVDEAVERRALPAVDAERWKFSALTDQKHVGAAVGQRLDLVDRAEAAAMPAGSAGVGTQRPLG